LNIFYQGINHPKWCPFENVTAYLTPEKSTGEVHISEQSAISVPVGVHQVIKKHNNRLCPYYVTVKGNDANCMCAFIKFVQHNLLLNA